MCITLQLRFNDNMSSSQGFQAYALCKLPQVTHHTSTVFLESAKKSTKHVISCAEYTRAYARLFSADGAESAVEFDICRNPAFGLAQCFCPHTCSRTFVAHLRSVSMCQQLS